MQVYTFGDNNSCCCGVGERGQAISTPTLVTTLQRIPCRQVATGQGYTLAITRVGEVFSWGCNSHGQLGHGNTQEQFRPLQIEHFDESNHVAQVSAGVCHTLAVTKSGQLFSWGYGSNYCLGHDDFLTELQPKRVEHGGFDDLFIASVSAGDEHSAAIDSSGHVRQNCILHLQNHTSAQIFVITLGLELEFFRDKLIAINVQVYTWGKGYCGALGHGVETDQRTPLLVAGLKSFRAVQVFKLHHFPHHTLINPRFPKSS